MSKESIMSDKTVVCNICNRTLEIMNQTEDSINVKPCKICADKQYQDGFQDGYEYCQDHVKEYLGHMWE